MSRLKLDKICRAAPQLRERFGVRELAVFGSVARGEDRPGSDIDVLVTFDGPADFDRFGGLKLCLEDLLGRPVDLVTRPALRPELRRAIEREAVRVALRPAVPGRHRRLLRLGHAVGRWAAPRRVLRGRAHL